MTHDDELEANRRAVVAVVSDIARSAAALGESSYAAPLVAAVNLAIETDDRLLLDGVLDLLRNTVEIRDRSVRLVFIRDEASRLLHEARSRGRA